MTRKLDSPSDWMFADPLLSEAEARWFARFAAIARQMPPPNEGPPPYPADDWGSPDDTVIEEYVP